MVLRAVWSICGVQNPPMPKIKAATHIPIEMIEVHRAHVR